MNGAKIEYKRLAVTMENVYRSGLNTVITVYIFVPKRRIAWRRRNSAWRRDFGFAKVALCVWAD